MCETDEALQREYYARTAGEYDRLHVNADDEHHFALAILAGLLPYLRATSVLDVGSGTGRALRYLREHARDVRVMGIEPVKELRQIGYEHGIPPTDLIDGDARSLPFGDGQFDVVCEFGVLHHVRLPEQVVSEMLRVARKGVFLSDSNSVGQGGAVRRGVKRVLRALGLADAVTYLRTRGRRYYISDSDGIAYPYSVFDSYDQVRARCSSVHLIVTQGRATDLYGAAGHVAVLGILRQ